GYPLDYTIYGHRFTNRTDLTGDIPKVHLDTDAKAIVFDINAVADGRLAVLPAKTLIQSLENNPDNNTETELPFEILVDGKSVNEGPSMVQGDLFWPEERMTRFSVVQGEPFWAQDGRTRFVAVEFPAGSKQIAIRGTYLRMGDPAVELEYGHALRFVPAFPTDKSNITANIRIDYPDLCHSAIFKGFTINENVIDFEVTHYHSGSFACPKAVWSRIFHANLDHLEAGEYATRLTINGTEEITKKLVVSSIDFEIVSTGRYTDRDDRNHIIAEIRNVGMHPVTNVSAVILFYDQNNVKIAEEFAFPEINLLNINHSSGLDYRIMNNDIKHAAVQIKINHYDTIENATTPDLSVIIDAKKFLQPYGDVFIGGTVTNNSDRLSSNQTIVVCVLYDSSNTLIIDTIVNRTRPARIEPGQTAEFVAYSNYHPVDSYYGARCSAGEETVGTRVIPEFGSNLKAIVWILVCITGVVVFPRFFRFSSLSTRS
ncbi:MAG: FxLYD domain-containing protein, partial [Nitrososphaera sp.]